MSDAAIEVQVDDRELRRVLRALQRRGDDLSGLMTGLGAEMESRVSARFETETDPAGTPWEAWSDGYEIERARRYPDANETILDRYGDMLDSLSYQADTDSVVVGFAAEYAAYHEWGTLWMPRRGLLMDDPDAGTLSDSDAEALLGVAEDYYADAL